MSTKGGKNEREVCRLLTQYVTGKRNPVIFWRQGGSGGIATQKFKREEESNQSGDIAAIQPEGNFLTDAFSIEAKWVKTFSFEEFFRPAGSRDKKKSVTAFWNQTIRDAARAKKRPMLIFKKNHSPYYIALRRSFLLPEISKATDLARRLNCESLMFSDFRYQQVMVFSFDTFAEMIPVDRLQAMLLTSL